MIVLYEAFAALKVEVRVRTRQPPIVLRHFTFPTPECLNFHTENTSICVQHSFRVKSSETLF